MGAFFRSDVDLLWWSCFLLQFINTAHLQQLSTPTAQLVEMASPEIRNQWREEILTGVQFLPRHGTPGIVVVYGENAEPILTLNSATDVFMAAAQFGVGRIVVFSQDVYSYKFLLPDVPQDFRNLHDRVMSWVTNKTHTDAWRTVKLDDTAFMDATVENTVMVWMANRPIKAELVDKLKEFVTKGGSLIVGVTPWGYMQVHRCDLDEVVCYSFLKEAGIYLTPLHSSISGPKAFVANNKAQDVHVGVLLKRLQAKEIQFSEVSPEILPLLGSILDEDGRDLLMKYFTDADIKDMVKSKPPNLNNPLTTNTERSAAIFANFLLKKTGIAAPGVEEFPGSFSDLPSLTSIEYKVESGYAEAHPVGAYLPPGGTMTVEILKGDTKGWKVQVGCHTDNLTSKRQFKRWPDIVVTKTLKTGGETRISSSFGGSVYVRSPNGNSSLSLCLKDVVPSPLFRLGDTPEDWAVNRIKPGLWADFVGKRIMLSLPSHSIREIEYPLEAVEFWDEVVMINRDLRSVDHDKARREWFVPDVQPIVGHMHSGYPIVTHMDVTNPGKSDFLVNKPKNASDLLSNHWAFFHELGHNMQDHRWTFGGTGEVTCNIFTLNVMEKLFGLSPWYNPGVHTLKGFMKAYLKNGANFDDWKKKPWISLGIYAQLARDFGFVTYKAVFERYEQETPNLENDQEKIDHWIKTFSNVTESNLVPAFQLWGFTVSESVQAELKGLKVYMPQDEVTQVVQTHYSTSTDANQDYSTSASGGM